MGLLAVPHWESVLPETRQVLEFLGSLSMLRPFYLGGGTGLALRLGHRVSQDLDLFANIETLDDKLRQSVIAALHSHHSLNILQNSQLGLVLEIDGLAASFFSYGYPLLAPTDSVNNVEVAGLADIGLMKLDAIAGRGMRKDFYDLYFITQQIPLTRLFAQIDDKYPHSRGFAMRVLTALVDFEIADQQEEPTLLAPVQWNQVKVFCAAEAQRLGRQWFDGDGTV